MKIYIVQELNQYSIYKVSDNLIRSFENEKRGPIVVESKSISEALIKFNSVDKINELAFNSEMIRYKAQLNERLDETELKQKRRIKL